MDSFLPGSFPLSSSADLESVEDELNIFGKVRVNDCILDSSYLELLPITTVSGDTREFVFEIPSTPLPKYLLLSDIFCSTRLSLVKVAKGSTKEEPVTAEDNVVLTDFSPDTLFSKFDTFIGDQPVSNSCDHRNVYVDIVRKSSFSKHALETYLAVENAAYNDFTVDSVESESHLRKVQKFCSSDPDQIPVVHQVGVLTHDFNTLKQPVPQTTSFKFKLKRAPDEVLIFGNPAPKQLTEEEADALAAQQVAEALAAASGQSGAGTSKASTESQASNEQSKKEYTFKVKMVSISLLVKRMTISNNLVKKHRQMFENGNVARYYFYRSISSWFSIPQGQSQFRSARLFSASSLPAKLFFCFFTQERLQGKFTLNSQKYQMPKNLVSVNLTLDNRTVDAFSSIYSEKLDDGMDNFLYTRLFQVMGNYYSNSGPPITKSQFLSDFFVIYFDLSASMESLENALPLIKSGDLKLSLEFSKTTDITYHCLTFASSPSLLTLDGNGQCAVSYRS